MKRWVIVLVCWSGITFAAEPEKSQRPVMLASLAQAAIGVTPPFSINVPVGPEFDGEVSRLQVLRKYRISKTKMGYEMRCLPAGSCTFPFIVIVEKAQAEEPEHRVDYVVGKGDLVVLKLIRKGFSAELVAVCMQRGGVNDRIGVKTLDRKQRFTAKIIDRGLVVSEMQERQ